MYVLQAIFFNNEIPKLVHIGPACRKYLFQWNQQDDSMRKFKCHNPMCKTESITRCDLSAIQQGNPRNLDPEDGHYCIHCGKQQKAAYLDKMAYDEETLECKTKDIMDSIDIIYKLNVKDELNAGNPDYEQKMVDWKIDRSYYHDKIKALIRFVHQPENVKVPFRGLIEKFPFVWKFVTSSRIFREIMDAYKDGYDDLITKGIIEPSNLLNRDNAKVIGGVIRKQIEQIDPDDVSTQVNDGLEFVDGIIDGAKDDSDNCIQLDDNVKKPIRNTIRSVSSTFNFDIDEEVATNVISNGVSLFGSLFRKE